MFPLVNSHDMLPWSMQGLNSISKRGHSTHSVSTLLNQLLPELVVKLLPSSSSGAACSHAAIGPCLRVLVSQRLKYHPHKIRTDVFSKHCLGITLGYSVNTGGWGTQHCCPSYVFNCSAQLEGRNSNDFYTKYERLSLLHLILWRFWGESAEGSKCWGMQWW